jgi:hypothetical protein
LVECMETPLMTKWLRQTWNLVECMETPLMTKWLKHYEWLRQTRNLVECMETPLMTNLKTPNINEHILGQEGQELNESNIHLLTKRSSMLSLELEVKFLLPDFWYVKGIGKVWILNHLKKHKLQICLLSMLWLLDLPKSKLVF